MSRARLPGGKGWRDDGPLIPIGAPPGPITRTFVPVEPPPVEPPQEEPPVSKIAVAAEPPTARQTETWEAVQRLGSQTAAAQELGITQAGVQGNLRGYMAHMGIDGELPGKLIAEEISKMRTEGGKLGGRPPTAKPEPEAKIGVIRNGRTIPAVAVMAPEPAPGPAEVIAPPESAEPTQRLDGLSLTLDLSVSVHELATWDPNRLSKFFSGIAQAISARRGL